jgi:hypothetical protein
MKTTSVIFALFTVAACGWDKPAAPSAEYPCGPEGVVCQTQHSCCPEYSTCGGEPASVGCPAGQCCDVGSQAFEKKRIVKQTPLSK